MFNVESCIWVREQTILTSCSSIQPLCTPELVSVFPSPCRLVFANFFMLLNHLRK